VLGRSVLENFPEVDWCIDGEGEFAFVELLRCIKAGKQRPERCVPGLIYRSAKAIRTTERRQLQNLAGMPDPDFEQYYSAAEELRKRYHIDVKPILPVEESRGCIYRCAFCSHWRYFDGHRLRPARDVADSIRRQSRRYGINSVALVSSLIITGGRQKLFRMIASQKKDYSMFCEVRADISREELALMKSAGVMRVQAGVEALDTALLKKMQKGTSVIENLSVMKHCEELGIYLSSNLIIEFPTETQDDIDRSIKAMDYVEAYRPPMRIVGFMLDDGSSVYLHPHRYGIYDVDESWPIGSHIPSRLTDRLILWYKDFKDRHPPRDYRALIKRHALWKRKYEAGGASGHHLLSYHNYKYKIVIMDQRRSPRKIVLRGMVHKLYIFCNTIKSWNEIKNKFSTEIPVDIKGHIFKLVRMKLMYMENDRFLSLAISDKAHPRA